MSKFTTPLVIEDLGNRRFKLKEPFSFWFFWDKKFFKSDPPKPGVKKYEINVLPGLITDYASVPRIFWNILPPIGKYGKAAVLHDALYQFNVFDRLVCDRIFLLGMKVLKVPVWKRHVMYYAVRLFGGNAYKHYQNRLIRRLPPLDDYEQGQVLVKIKTIKGG